MNIPKEYQGAAWEPQEIITDQHLRISSLKQRVKKLRAQRDEAIKSNSAIDGKTT